MGSGICCRLHDLQYVAMGEHLQEVAVEAHYLPCPRLIRQRRQLLETREAGAAGCPFSVLPAAAQGALQGHPVMADCLGL